MRLPRLLVIRSTKTHSCPCPHQQLTRADDISIPTLTSVLLRRSRDLVMVSHPLHNQKLIFNTYQTFCTLASLYLALKYANKIRLNELTIISGQLKYTLMPFLLTRVMYLSIFDAI